MQLGDLTFGQLLGAGVVILLIIGIYNTVMTAIKNWIDSKRRHNAPVDELKMRVDAHDKMLDNDKRRFENMEERISSMREESSMTLRGVRALLSHEINGNSIEKLQESYNSIDDYLIGRK